MSWRPPRMTGTWNQGFRVCKYKHIVTLLFDNPNAEVPFHHCFVPFNGAVLGHSLQSTVAVSAPICLSPPRLERLPDWYSIQPSVMLLKGCDRTRLYRLSCCMYVFMVLCLGVGTTFT
jgi:hypothetical protein